MLRFAMIPAVGVAGLLLSACASDDEERPPVYVPGTSPTQSVTCTELIVAQPQPNEGERFVVDGSAACSAEGQYCPTPWGSGACEGGQAYASCALGVWVLECSPDGAAADGDVVDAEEEVVED